MKAYFELEPGIREMLVQHFKERLTASRADPVEMTAEEAEKTSVVPEETGIVPEKTVEELEAEYKKVA